MLVRDQDKRTGLWHQTVGNPGQPGNYVIPSGTYLFVYALQKGVRLGYLPHQDSSNATRAWQGVLGHFVRTGTSDSVTILETDGSNALGISPATNNDLAETGEFLLAST
jgi:unsaturated rhamnogalacturonyl hydrolase